MRVGIRQDTTMTNSNQISVLDMVGKIGKYKLNDRIKKKRGLFNNTYNLHDTVMMNVGFGLAELLFGDDHKSPVKFGVKNV